jgi:hypothetical protein
LWLGLGRRVLSPPTHRIGTDPGFFDGVGVGGRPTLTCHGDRLLKLQDKVWRILTNTVRLGPNEYRVIRPARPIQHAPLHDSRFGAEMTVDKAATVDLAFAWWLAARSRHSLVYLPLRSSAATCGGWGEGRRLDLVLLHHSLGLPVSRWKEVRARLAKGDPHTVKLPAEPFRETSQAGYDARWSHNEFRDYLRWDIAADTLFLIGSRKAFELDAGQILGLAEDGPAQMAARPDEHFCAELRIGRWHGPRDRRSPPADLHVVCCNDHW